MFCFETSNVILIIIILITKDIQILALDLQFNDYQYDFKNRFKRLKYNVNKQDKIDPINKRIFEDNDNMIIKDNCEKQIPNSYRQEISYDDTKEQRKKNSYQNFDFEDESYQYDYDSPSYLPSQIYRRDVPSSSAHTKNLQNNSLYPSVLTKALEISLYNSPPTITGQSVFSNVAQKMNISTLDLAKKIVASGTSNNDQFANLVQNYIKNNTASALSLGPTRNMATNDQLNMGNELVRNEQYLENNEHFDGIKTSNLAGILDRILYKLDSIYETKNKEVEKHPDGVPCDVIGSWSSNTMGFCFDIQLIKKQIHDISPAELNNKILSISISECIPPKRHQFIDLEWKFTGSAIKQLGGPFHVYGQKRQESITATFLGFCRKCDGIDTIFGSWNLLSPSKDCRDISLASEVKRDVLRRVRMETKRRERFKTLLYQSYHTKL